MNYKDMKIPKLLNIYDNNKLLKFTACLVNAIDI